MINLRIITYWYFTDGLILVCLTVLVSFITSWDREDIELTLLTAVTEQGACQAVNSIGG